jgi:hypothetical protein
MFDYYDKSGNPITQERYYELSSDWEYRRIAETVLSNGYWVSTVWLGLDHGEGRTLETMVFRHDGQRVTDWLELDARRYHTEEEAIEGHLEIALKWKHAGELLDKE